jgi:hypothetical protein
MKTPRKKTAPKKTDHDAWDKQLAADDSAGRLDHLKQLTGVQHCPRRKDGTFRRGNKAALKGESARVVLVAQRVDHKTLVALQERRKLYGSIGRAIDAAVQSLLMLERTLGERRAAQDR